MDKIGIVHKSITNEGEFLVGYRGLKFETESLPFEHIDDSDANNQPYGRSSAVALADAVYRDFDTAVRRSRVTISSPDMMLDLLERADHNMASFR